MWQKTSDTSQLSRLALLRLAITHLALSSLTLLHPALSRFALSPHALSRFAGRIQSLTKNTSCHLNKDTSMHADRSNTCIRGFVIVPKKASPRCSIICAPQGYCTNNFSAQNWFWAHNCKKSMIVLLYTFWSSFAAKEFCSRKKNHWVAKR